MRYSGVTPMAAVRLHFVAACLPLLHWCCSWPQLGCLRTGGPPVLSQLARQCQVPGLWCIAVMALAVVLPQLYCSEVGGVTTGRCCLSVLPVGDQRWQGLQVLQSTSCYEGLASLAVCCQATNGELHHQTSSSFLLYLAARVHTSTIYVHTKTALMLLGSWAIHGADPACHMCRSQSWAGHRISACS
jgi:hypothetical protein